MIKVDDFQHIYNLKVIRAFALKMFVPKIKVVCFSCGTAIEPLEQFGFDVLYIGENGDLKPNRWFTKYEIADIFPNRFDVTCGHLSIGLMRELAVQYKERIGDIEDREYNIPTGSGETLVCLKMAFPDIKFNAIYNLDKCTEYHEEAPLNRLVKLVANKIILNPKEEEG